MPFGAGVSDGSPASSPTPPPVMKKQVIIIKKQLNRVNIIKISSVVYGEWPSRRAVGWVERFKVGCRV